MFCGILAEATAAKATAAAAVTGGSCARVPQRPLAVAEGRFWEALFPSVGTP